MSMPYIVPPLDPVELAVRIKAIPRVRLAALPTPLEYCPQLSEALGGPRILVKRDDLTGLAFGGNKTRNLEFRLAEALSQGADTIVVALDAISNSARQTAAAANRLGLRSVLVLRGQRPTEIQGNLLVDYLLGADVRLVDVAEEQDLLAVALEVTEELRGRGLCPFLLNESPMFPVASALAYTLCLMELHAQLKAMGVQGHWIYLSSASKGQAGLVLGCKALGLDYNVVGIAARHNPEGATATARIANDAARLLNIRMTVSADEIQNDDRYVGDEYGRPTSDALGAIDLAARTEGLILDPVYTGKALAGLIDHVNQGRFVPDTTVVFIHTGGTPAIFAFASQLLGSGVRAEC